MDRAREAGRPAGPLLVVRLGRNAGCHLVLDITFPPFRMIAPCAKFKEGRYDLLVEAEQNEQLCQKWKLPEIWR